MHQAADDDDEDLRALSRQRFAQFILVVFIGINVAYLITHLTPIDPVEQAISSVTMFGQSSPEMVEVMRKALRELYGLEGSAWEQYAAFWRRLATGDFGPSLSAFPTPVSTLIWQALPWTVGLLVSLDADRLDASAIFSAVSPATTAGTLLLKAFGILAMSLQPIPYYIVAFVLLFVFGFVWPVLPISGGAEMNIDRQGFAFALSIVQAFHPARAFARACGRWADGSSACARSSPTS